ncbi:MAG: tripartite tricarboxylate transporter substrate binding protein [Alphaproteobacteria bacterium]|nr:tripartite tricarboxylate transporter substrate binding protein [Alphaproteobacteria bacterium]
MIARRTLLLSSLLATTTAARAQAWPARPLRLVVPFAAGAGILDIMGRQISGPLGERLGQQVVIDNKPGAGGNVGADIVAKAAPDGYTLMVGSTAMFVAPALYANVPFDPLADFVPVTQINSAPLLLVVHPSLPVKSVAEFIAYARANPGKLNYGSGGVGATPFLAVESLRAVVGFEAVHVPYRGGAPALADLVAGQLSFMIENVPGTLPLVRDGRLRALAITSSKRSALVPELPTMQEAGVPGYEMIGWNGIFAPRGTPPEIVKRLNDELAAILRTPEMTEQFAKLGAEAVGSSPSEFAAFVKAESARWLKIIRDKGIKPE